jgi:hypothetical protein
MRYILKGVALIGLMLTSHVASAKPDGRTLDQELKSLANRFARVDTDGNGKVDQAELLVENQRIAARDNKPVSGTKGGVLGSNGDTDGDGMVSLAEAEVAVKAQFERRDTNKDGIVTEDEKAATK